MDDPKDRFRSLDHQSAPDLWSEATARADAAPPEQGWLPRLGGAVAVVAVVVLAAVVGLQLSAGPGPVPGGSPEPDGATASVTDGDFRLTVSSPRSTWGSDEAIQVGATLEYLGPAVEATLWGSGGGVVAFSLVEVNGDRRMEAASEGDCVPHSIAADEPMTIPYTKSGGYSAGDPNAAFYEAFFAEPLLYLPPGEWEVSAVAVFDAGDTCTAAPLEMTATITLTIEDRGEPSMEPTTSAEPSAPPSVAPEPSIGPEPPFTCDVPITLAASGSDFHPLVLQDIRVWTVANDSGEFDRIIFEYDGGTPSLELDLAEPPFVQDPSGLPMEVAGSPIYRITLVGATKYDTETGEQPYQGPTDFEGYPQIVQFVESGDFEAVHNWYLGTNGATCLRAFIVTDPIRLVIDIEH